MAFVRSNDECSGVAHTGGNVIHSDSHREIRKL